jgi:hypothetical protein
LFGPASPFIDWFAARDYGGGAFVGGVGYCGGAWHGAWYAHPDAGFAAGGGRRGGLRALSLSAVLLKSSGRDGGI